MGSGGILNVYLCLFGGKGKSTQLSDFAWNKAKNLRSKDCLRYEIPWDKAPKLVEIPDMASPSSYTLYYLYLSQPWRRKVYYYCYFWLDYYSSLSCTFRNARNCCKQQSSGMWIAWTVHKEGWFALRCAHCDHSSASFDSHPFLLTNLFLPTVSFTFQFSLPLFVPFQTEASESPSVWGADGHLQLDACTAAGERLHFVRRDFFVDTKCDSHNSHPFFWSFWLTMLTFVHLM